MQRLVVDAMGSDAGSKMVVEAVKNFLNENNDVELAVVGKKEELTELENLCRVVDARSVVPMTAGALEVMRMKDSSIYTALKLMKDENYDGVVSSGSTGAYLSACTLILKLIPGVKRAALVAPFPTAIKNKRAVVLDVGASNENSAEELAQFALMGSLYSKAVFNVNDPNVYLLNNGTEEGKGAPEVKEAYKILKENNFPGFKGNIEAKTALLGDADVIVCDGFTGNIFLKGSEGMAKLITSMVKKSFKRNLWSMLGYLHVHKGMKEMKETLDYKSIGGAMLLGVNGVVVKAHGSSDSYSFKCAMNVANKLIKGKVKDKIYEGLKNE